MGSRWETVRRGLQLAAAAVCVAVWLLLLLITTGCTAPAAAGQGELTAAVDQVQLTVAEVAAPAVVATREAVEALPVVRELPPPPAPLVAPCAVELIVHYEVTSPAHYGRRLEGVIWPGGASGATWGVGYDGGHQTRGVIARDWDRHEARERLAGTAGVTGAPARALVRTLQDVRTPYGYAYEVFEGASLPVYHDRARRAFGEPFEHLPPPAAGALVSLVYNRGASMAGESRREMRALRDVCVPAGDQQCIAREIRAMCRLWEGTPNGPGLCRRRDDEARLALQEACA